MKNRGMFKVITFIGKIILYFFVIVMLIYLYHYKNVQGGTFIYNEF
ncbi:teichoic acid D-Ala incorporation-associated protein DltX [Enterococcus casseliflavus]|nr:teichoic acid D-Ala incorporation-associated protein DltX [Enterococcus casseliflavus]MEB8418491.1 teichoic acid D-Ala incorporation-associated protein DltX [Enterococcus casseliflavus]